MPSERARRGTRRRLSKPSAVLAEQWTTLDGIEVFHRESPGPADGSDMAHLHGFGFSGAYLVPTAERLAGEFHTFVPDLPGFGRSGNSARPLDVTDLAHAAASFLDDRGIESATLVGNSIPTGWTVPCSSRPPVVGTTSRFSAPCASWSPTGSGNRQGWFWSRSRTT